MKRNKSTYYYSLVELMRFHETRDSKDGIIFETISLGLTMFNYFRKNMRFSSFFRKTLVYFSYFIVFLPLFLIPDKQKSSSEETNIFKWLSFTKHVSEFIGDNWFGMLRSRRCKVFRLFIICHQEYKSKLSNFCHL